MADLYEFKMKYTEMDKSGYYHTRWDRGVVTEVVASTKEEAFEKLWVLLGKCNRSGFCWTAQLLSVRDHRIASKEGGEQS